MEHNENPSTNKLSRAINYHFPDPPHTYWPAAISHYIRIKPALPPPRGEWELKYRQSSSCDRGVGRRRRAKKLLFVRLGPRPPSQLGRRAGEQEVAKNVGQPRRTAPHQLHILSVRAILPHPHMCALSLWLVGRLDWAGCPPGWRAGWSLVLSGRASLPRTSAGRVVCELDCNDVQASSPATAKSCAGGIAIRLQTEELLPPPLFQHSVHFSSYSAPYL